MKIGSYVNSGIIMKCCSNWINDVTAYNVFIAFGIFILFMTGAMMYSTLENFTKTKGQKILALVISIIYVMGYPLNSLLFGFEYLSMAILIFGTILNMIYYYEKEELNFSFYVIIFALLNFEIFCSYYMLVPYVYSGLWIYFCIQSKKKNNKIICKKNVIMLTVALLLPFFLGYIYNIAPSIYNILQIDAYEALLESMETSSRLLNHAFAMYGYIYINFYSNTLLLIPLVLYYIYKRIKEKEFFSADIIIFIILLIFMGILGIGVKFEKVSVYYLMKNYYALWLMLIYMNFRALMYIYEKNKAMSCGLVVFYVILIVLNLIFVDVPLGKEPQNENENIANVVEIFGVNKTIIKDRQEDLNTEEIEILQYAKENLDFDNNSVEVIGDAEQIFWTYSMLRYINDDEFSDYSGQDRLTLKATKSYKKIGKVDYMIYFNRSMFFPKGKDILFENGDVIYENSSGGIVSYKKN